MNCHINALNLSDQKKNDKCLATFLHYLPIYGCSNCVLPANRMNEKATSGEKVSFVFQIVYYYFEFFLPKLTYFRTFCMACSST